MYVLLPSKAVGTKSLEDTDLAGPLLFALALGVSLMLTGKLQFGFIYGCSLMGSVFMWAVLNLLHEQGIDMYRVCSVLGYGLVPIVLLALFNVVLDLKGHVGFLLSLLAIFWCAFSASRLFEKMLELAEQRWLVAYPLCLVYTCFALITVF
jgi:apolipoprotein N-acyltransferase